MRDVRFFSNLGILRQSRYEAYQISMKCPKCESDNTFQISTGQNICRNCEHIFTLNKINLKNKPKRTIMRVFLYFTGIVSTLVLFNAGVIMSSIRTISSDTIAEAFYNAVGQATIGLSFFVGAVLFGLASLLGKGE
jgi:ribosomal protein L37AE/L43A